MPNPWSAWLSPDVTEKGIFTDLTMGRWLGLSGASECHHQCPYDKEAEGHYVSTRGHVTTGRVMWPQAKNSWDHQELEGAGRALAGGPWREPAPPTPRLWSSDNRSGLLG